MQTKSILYKFSFWLFKHLEEQPKIKLPNFRALTNFCDIAYSFTRLLENLVILAKEISNSWAYLLK